MNGSEFNCTSFVPLCGRFLFGALLASLVLLTHSTQVQAKNESWSHTVEFKFARKASIRVVEPEGFTVQLGQTKDTVPTVLQVPNSDSYQGITITAPSGETWTKKIEVRAQHQTVLRVKFAASAKKGSKPEAKAAPKFVGRIRNSMARCKPQRRFALRFDFMKEGELKLKVQATPDQKLKSVEVEKGLYDVRVYIYDGTKQWQWWKTNKLDINKDGWETSAGC